jgi:hypothetical protein
MAFGYIALDYRDYVRDDGVAFRPNEWVQLVGNGAKA